jgi:4,5-dihydroxyphthalate decarboxylase
MIAITASLTPEGLVLPIVEGAVAFDGVELTINVQKSIDKNSRQMIEGKFDLCEMSLATFLKARLEGLPIVALPAFTGRRFLQPTVLCAPGAGIGAMKDLAGKRIGLPQYWMTSSVWHRGLLEEVYGVKQAEADWITTASERLGALTFPAGVSVRHVATQSGPTELLDQGTVDCVMLPKLTRRSPDWTSPFTDVTEAQIDYYAASGVFPIMHLVVMSATLAGRHPDLPRRLMAGLTEARRRATAEPPIAGLDPTRARTLFGDDPYPYGLAANRKSLDAFLRYAHGQGLVDRAIAADSLFAAGAEA